MQKKIALFCICQLMFVLAWAQTEPPVFYKGAIKENKTMLHRSIVQNTITKNLSLPLNADTEENWMDAFWALELLQYRAPWISSKINFAFDSISKRTSSFQRALLELAFSNYPGLYQKQVKSLLKITNNAKVFAMAAEYLMKNDQPALAEIRLLATQKQTTFLGPEAAIMHQLQARLLAASTNAVPLIRQLLHPSFLPQQTVLFSIQRKNRDFPGLALIRQTNGLFVKDSSGNLFTVPQLARSISNLPGYLTNGNTPQGIFRMFGFDTSKTTFIGPTTNIQLTMPFETSLKHFFGDSTILDSVWNIEWYKRLIPNPLQNFTPLFETFYAGMAGRTEIIAHGTTVDPTYYTGAPYFPQTPTMGCLCTKETWSEEDGRRLESDQLKLTTALRIAGGPNGYCVVIELGDEQRPVSPADVEQLINNINL